MKSSEEMRLHLEQLMGWGLETQWGYGGTPMGANTVFCYLRVIWAELTERTSDYYQAMADCDSERGGEPLVPDYWLAISNDPLVYTRVVAFWRAVDKQLGIEYPPG